MRHKISAPRLSFIAIAAALCLAGCSADSTPDASAFPASTQPIISSSANWQTIASDMWSEIDSRMQAAGLAQPMIGLEPPAKKTAFTQAMNNFLYTDIINSGIGIAPDSEFTLTYSMQVIRYGDDWASDNDGDAELVLTFSVTDGNSVRLRESKIFYISGDDVRLYDSGSSANTSSVVTSNWYSDNPHDADRMAMAEENQFSVDIDEKDGPVYNINSATVIASAHCQSIGKSSARFLNEGYPTNDRKVLKTIFQCQ